jgi:hypothetical protein
LMAGQVVGTWRLNVYDLHTADGNVSFPLGPDCSGVRHVHPGRVRVR